MHSYTLHWNVSGCSNVPCPVCGETGSSELACIMDNTTIFSKLIKCKNCESIFYESPHQVGYLQNSDNNEWKTKWYVELGVGIEAILDPILSIDVPQKTTLLDIGCGFGFSLDFWKNFYDGKAVGLEKAYYGQQGKHWLNVDIRDTYLTNDTVCASEKFDVVYACEVIEHTSDPAAFIAVALSSLADGGVICLTAPTASAITPNSNLPLILQSLSPTQHIFLPSEKGLCMLLHNAGVPYVYTLDKGPRLILWASTHPIPSLQWRHHNTLAQAYLKKLGEHENFWIRGGALYRRLCDAVNRGQYQAALTLQALLRDCVYHAYGYDIYDMNDVISKMPLMAHHDVLMKVPCYLGHALCYMGLMQEKLKNTTKSLSFFEQAQKVLNIPLDTLSWETDNLRKKAADKITAHTTRHMACGSHRSSRQAPKKIALIQATSDSLGEAADFTLPYTLAAISAWLKRAQPDTEVFLASTLKNALEADEIWCTSLSETWGNAIAMGKIVTETGKKFIVGGHQASALPETMPYGTIFHGPLEHYTHLDELPLPDWSIFPDIHRKNGIIMTSRGCPFSCNFCSSRAFWKGYQAKTAERVITEIQQLADLGISNIFIFDDLFTADKRRLQKISDLISAEGLNFLNFNCLVRSDTLDYDTIFLLKKMNVQGIAFGSESGDDAMLEKMNKKTKVKQNLQAIKMLNNMGYKPNTSLVVGYPGETRETLKRTCEYMESIRPHTGIVDIYPVIPYPGTPLWDVLKKLYNPNLSTFDWTSLALRSNAVDWDKYFMLSTGCTINDIRHVAEWNNDYYHNKR